MTGDLAISLGPWLGFAAGLALGVLTEPAFRMMNVVFAPATRNETRHGLAVDVASAVAARNGLLRGDAATAVLVCERPTEDRESPVRPSRDAVPVANRRSDGEWRSAGEHAAALLSWLQAPGGLTGEIAADEILEIYRDMCCQAGLAVRPWQPVAVELRKALGGEKTYAWRGRNRVRVYRVPTGSAAGVPNTNRKLSASQNETRMAA